MARVKRARPGRPKMGTASREFGLVPIPPLTNPFSSSRAQSSLAIWLPLVPQPITVGTTSYASALNITAASIPNFSSYAAVWEEYVIRAIKWEYQPCGTQNGVMKLYVDEADNSTPTATTAKNHIGPIVPCRGYTSDKCRLNWTARDTGDLQFRATSVTSTFITSLKVYSDTANYGLVGTSEVVGVVSAWACVQFRTQGGA